jgi:hypothetical protein
MESQTCKALYKVMAAQPTVCRDMQRTLSEGIYTGVPHDVLRSHSQEDLAHLEDKLSLPTQLMANPLLRVVN